MTQKKSCRKKLSKNAAAFDYIDKISIALFATSGGVWIISSVSVVGAPIRIAGTRLFCVNFFFNHRNNKEITEYKKKQKEKALYNSYVGLK